ncbi:MAG: hypothetical protein Q4C99_04460 [Clostridia bacterium]|nr:hypothetical protein [Clostridia bacterium]
MTNNSKLTPKNRKSVLTKAVIFPLVAGIIIAAVAVGFHFGGSFFDITNNSNIAYFDTKNGGTEIAKFQFGNNEFSVADGYDYSFLNNGACYTNGSRFGEVGVGYYLVSENKISSFNKKNVTVTVGDKTYKYGYKNKFSAKNETEVFTHNCDASKGIVIYCQNAEKYGFSSDYTALVYEEVTE